jgi:hypothetical protein
MWDLRLSEFRLRRLLYPYMRRCKIRQAVIYVSKEHAASIFRVENMLTINEKEACSLLGARLKYCHVYGV